MTLDVHHPSPTDVDPLGEGLSARRCRQRASEGDKNQQFHEDVFHGCSPFAFNSPARCPATSTVMLAFACVTLVVGFGLIHSALAQESTSISTIVARVTGTIIRAL